MALPAHRVIGHKEYGNRPPGGRPGRKQDPRYDMDWRRQRVANFVPRSGNIGTPVPNLDMGDPDMRVIRDPNGTIHTITDLEIVRVADPVLSGAAQKVWTDGKIVDVSWPEMDALAADIHRRRLDSSIVPWLYVGAEGGTDAYQRLNDILDRVMALGGGETGGDDDLKAFISGQIDRAFAEFRERVAEGYDVRLEPKEDQPATPGA